MPVIVHFSGTNIIQIRSVLNRFHDGVSVIVPHPAIGAKLDVAMIQLGPVTVGQLSFGTPLTLRMATVDAFHVSMPTTGRMRARHAGQEVEATPAIGVVFGPGGPAQTAHEADSAMLAVKIERAALEQELAALLGRPIEEPLALPPVLDLSAGPGHSWARLIRLLRDELEFKESLICQPLIAEQLCSSVLSGLLLSLPHRYQEELAGPVAPGPPRALRRVLEAIHGEPERPFSVSDLAAVAGMSVRSLQEGFRRYVGCTPMAYLHQERLARAHEALRRADPLRVTVAAVAHRWGFAHLGRFASAYRARFGRSPSETLRGDG